VLARPEPVHPERAAHAAALKRGAVDIAYFLHGPVAEDVRRTRGLKLLAMRTSGAFVLDFVDRWDPKFLGRSPCKSGTRTASMAATSRSIRRASRCRRR
jgi:hypothetical protein